MRLGVELMGAIRQKRLDVRLVLTFEEDYEDILEHRVSGMQKIGLGYGPCDLPRVARRVWERLSPFGVILVDSAFPNHLVKQANADKAHVLAFNCDPGTQPVEGAYPRDPDQQACWQEAGLAGFVAEPVDPHSLFVEAQVDTTLKSLVCGGEERTLWWWHGDAGAATAFVRAWRASALAEDGVLFVSSDSGRIADDAADVAISTWNRRPLDAGSVVWADEPRWYGAIASSVAGGHLAQCAQATLWSALSGGSAISIAPGLESLHPDLAEKLQQVEDSDSVLQQWVAYRDSPLEARRHGDICRRLFWDERRKLQKVIDEFLQRVFDW